jgi:hypothetical protein
MIANQIGSCNYWMKGDQRRNVGRAQYHWKPNTKVALIGVNCKTQYQSGIDEVKGGNKNKGEWH